MQRWMLSVMLIGIVLASCTKPEPQPRVQSKVRPSVQCRFPKELRLRSDSFMVYGIGAYAGLAPTAQGSEAKVAVTEEKKPVLLVLSAYQSVHWRIAVSPRAKLVGVLASGHFAPKVTGVPAGVPVIITSETAQKPGCPALVAYEAGPGLLKANAVVRKFTGREFDQFIAQAEDEVFYAGPSNPLPVDEYSRARGTGSIDSAWALARLVEKGDIRLATADDISAWEEGANRKYRRFSKSLRIAHRMREGETYVLVRNITLPGGLTGDEARSFIVPRGIKRPSDPGGNNLFYSMKGFGCVKGNGLPCR